MRDTHGVLANFLPGVRELRAPLAAGYIWLLSVWLIVEPHVASRSKATGALAALYKLGDALSAVGLGVVISFIAYLLGTLSIGMWEAPLRAAMSVWPRLVSLLRPLPRSRWVETEISGLVPRLESPRLSSRGSRSIVTLSETVLQRQRRAAEWERIPWGRFLAEDDFRRQERKLGDLMRSDGDGESETINVGILAGQVVDELDLVEARLMSDEPELFNYVDRSRAESELRLAIIPPLVVLAGVLAIQDSVSWLVAVLPLVVFFQQAVGLLQRSGDRLADALLNGKVKAPVLEGLELAASEDLNAKRERGSGSSSIVHAK